MSALVLGLVSDRLRLVIGWACAMIVGEAFGLYLRMVQFGSPLEILIAYTSKLEKPLAKHLDCH